MNEQQIKKFILENEEIDIFYQYLIGQDVWYFQKFNNSETSYDEFKKSISRKLGIPFNNIAIVGSAKTKFSFSPLKNFKEFNDDSDFDLIIVSNKMYSDIWNTYREIASESHLKGYSSKCSNIFNGFISLKDTDSTYGKFVLEDWQRKVNTFKAELQLRFNIHHEVNYRIYSSWETVQDYHIKGITKLKESLNEIN